METKSLIYKMGTITALFAAMTILFAVGCNEQETAVPEGRAEEKVTPKAPQAPKVPETKESLKVKLQTTKGDIIIELNESKAPVTVKNFLGYVNEGFYDGTIFHRVMNGFMIQGGGHTPDMTEKQTHPPIVNEASNGLKNDRGTIAMARKPNPDSATSQFFINHKNNSNLNYIAGRSPGYAVFGKVVEGMEVVDAIAAVKTMRKGQQGNLPVETVLIKTVKIISEK